LINQIFVKVDWPLNVILNSVEISKYNQVFSFLLQIKRAKSAIDSMNIASRKKRKESTSTSSPTSVPTSVRTSVPTSVPTHTLILFRGQLLHFVNNLQNYIVNRVMFCGRLVG
jgi:hypothetical protein